MSDGSSTLGHCTSVDPTSPPPRSSRRRRNTTRRLQASQIPKAGRGRRADSQVVVGRMPPPPPPLYTFRVDGAIGSEPSRACTRSTTHASSQPRRSVGNEARWPASVEPSPRAARTSRRTASTTWSRRRRSAPPPRLPRCEPDRARAVAELVEGAAEVCREAGVALSGARRQSSRDLPGDELDFAGTCVGIVDRSG